MKKDPQKPSLLQISSNVADQLLFSEGLYDAVKQPKVRRSWHILFFSTFSFLILLLLSNFLSSSFSDVKNAVLILRIFKLIGGIYILFCLFFLSFYHYKYLLLTGKDLKFNNILFFYVFGIMLFGLIYSALYFINPSLFSYANPILVPTSTIEHHGLKGFILVLDFNVYSSCVALSLDYPRICSSSFAVSLVNIFEVLFSIAFIALFVGIFVQKSSVIGNDSMSNKANSDDAKKRRG